MATDTATDTISTEQDQVALTSSITATIMAVMDAHPGPTTDVMAQDIAAAIIDELSLSRSYAPTLDALYSSAAGQQVLPLDGFLLLRS